MAKRRRIWLGVLLVAIAGGALWLLVPSREPVYQGRPISAWLDDYAWGKARDLCSAMRATGTNCVPHLVRHLEQEDSVLRSNYFALYSKSPKIIQNVLPRPKRGIGDTDAANAFICIGPDSIPIAMALLKHRSPTVRRAAASGLGGLRRNSPAAVKGIPALTEALADKERMVRFFATIALMEMGTEASNAVSALTRVLADRGAGTKTNQFFYLRAAAAATLGKIGRPAIGALPELKQALEEPNSYLRGQAAVAIWRVDHDVDTALPILLREFSSDRYWDWIVALGEIGPQAKAAIPQLEQELKRTQDKWTLKLITDALIKIDPAAAVEMGVKKPD